MNREPQRKGFTIIEVALVLAVSGLILIGIISGVSGSVARQRYNDSVQSITERFRVVYNQANNPQGLSDNGGNSPDRAIYGKLVLISDTSQGAQINSYTITGDVASDKAAQTSAALDALKESDPAVVTDSLDTYTAPWGAKLEKNKDETNSSQSAKGAFLIIHSPNGGSIHTYYTSEHNTVKKFDKILEKAITQEVNFCVNSPDVNSAGGSRRNIRISSDGRNSSAIQLIDIDGGASKC